MSLESRFWGSGWSFPPVFERGNNELEISHEATNINQSINIILNTQRGERTMMPSFGSDLHTFLFKNIDATIKGQIIDSVKHTLLEHEPRIDVESVTLDIYRELEPVVQIYILYVIRKTNSRHNYVFPFYINEGTNLDITQYEK